MQCRMLSTLFVRQRTLRLFHNGYGSSEKLKFISSSNRAPSYKSSFFKMSKEAPTSKPISENGLKTKLIKFLEWLLYSFWLYVIVPFSTVHFVGPYITNGKK